MRRIRAVMRLPVLAGCVALASGCAGFRLHTEQPDARRLAACSARVVRFPFAAPAGDHYQFVLGVPATSSTDVPAPPFSGVLVIRRRQQGVLRLPVSSRAAEPCNWLEDQGHSRGYLLTSGPTLDNALRQGTSYGVALRFSRRPPAGSSLWLCWLHY